MLAVFWLLLMTGLVCCQFTRS